MIEPTPTATAAQIQRDGRLVMRLIKIIAKVDLPEVIEVMPDRPTILAGNHRSLLDVFASAAVVANAGVSCRLLVQARYFDNKLAGRWLRRIGCIALNADTRDQAFAEAIAALERGELVGIMPEGRLVAPDQRDPQTGPGRPGVSELALLANARVQPIVFYNTDLAWPRGRWPRLSLRRPTVVLRLGDSFDLPSADHDENAKFIMEELTKMLDELDGTTRR